MLVTINTPMKTITPSDTPTASWTRRAGGQQSIAQLSQFSPISPLHWLSPQTRERWERERERREGFIYTALLLQSRALLFLAVTVMCCPIAIWMFPTFRCAMMKFSPAKLICTFSAKNLSPSFPHTESVCVDNWPSFPTQGPQVSLPYI